MYLQSNVSLKDRNTFGIDVSCQTLIGINAIEDISEALNNYGKPLLIMGGGSNILFTRPVEGVLWEIDIQGIEYSVINETETELIAGAGVNWHDLVLDSLNKGYSGLENLSLIPGKVGAAPIQNIGAYGVELKDSLVWVEAFELATGVLKQFTVEECQFGYRDSYFKNEKGRFLITRICLRLSQVPALKLDYGDIGKVLRDTGITEPMPNDVSDAVISIRRSKLPDPAEIGNAGSFFKNPTVPRATYDALLLQFPNIPMYPAADDWAKIPAAWLIEQCGFKGKVVGQTGSHAKQALVIVNYGNASGTEILEYAQSIIAAVKEKFGIVLTPEVNIW
ncbi:MAG: UDP-N-acetylmuramate dehydrogenase [Saprospiraceae bacterium]